MAITLRRKELDLVDKQSALALGISSQEYDFIIDKLGRQINEPECVIIAAMWCERISKKSLSGLIKEISESNVLEKACEQQVCFASNGMRFLDVGDGQGVCLSLVQNNEESKLFPEYGAALCVSDALEKLIPNGVRPLGVSTVIRVGGAESGEAQQSVRSMVNGCAAFLNVAGLPLAEVDFEFVSDIRKDLVFNSSVLGLVDSSIAVKRSSDAVSDAVLVYIGWDSQATIKIDEPDGNSRVVRRVKASSPFMYDCLRKALAQSIKQDLLIDVTSISHGGVLTGSFELAYRNKVGLVVYADKVPIDKKDPELSDVLFSETPHRLLVLIHKDKHRQFSDILRKYNINSVTIGNAADNTDVSFCLGHYVMAGLPAKVIVDGMTESDAQSQAMRNCHVNSTGEDDINLRSINISRCAPMELLSHSAKGYTGTDDPLELGDRWMELIAMPNEGSRSVVRELSDLRFNGKLLPDIKSGVSVFKLGLNAKQDKGVVSSLKANCLYSQIDAYLGTAHTIAEAMRCVATTGATPSALGYVLNYPALGNRMVLRHLTESARAICDACDVWGLQVLDSEVSAVSFAESELDIPTPTIVVLGVMPDVTKRVPNYIKEQGLVAFLLGRLPNSLGCSAYVNMWYGKEACVVPEVNFESEKKLCLLLVELAQLGVLSCATEVGRGGLALSLVESATGNASGKQHGVTISFYDKIAPEVALFGECSGLAFVCCLEKDSGLVRECAQKHGIEISAEGFTGGQNIVCKVGSTDYSLGLKATRKVSNEALSHIFEARRDEYRL